MTRLYVARQDWHMGDMRYAKMYNISIPQPHTSGYWEHGFDFTNDFFILLAVL
jgi:hypothetical protein